MNLAKHLSFLCAATLLTVCGPVRVTQQVTADGQAPLTPDSGSLGAVGEVRIDSVPFTSGSNGYAVYRAPTMVLSQRGTILAFAEGRVNGPADEDDMDVVLRRSIDGGRTWLPLQVLANDGKNPCKNQSPVVLPSGRILLVWLWNPWIPSENLRDTISRKVFVMYSDDDGVSWSKSRDITDSAQLMSGPNKWGWTGMGPVHGIVKQREPFKGRILFGARHGFADDSSKGVSHVIYSDDNGESWNIGGSVPRQKTSESTVVELSNGDIMLNSRNQRGDENVRVVSISKDGGATFKKTDVRLDAALIEPAGVQGSLIFHSMNQTTKMGNILFSNPADPNNRCNGTIKLSTDDGLTWTESETYAPQACPYFTGYSDMVVFANGKIGVLYERGKVSPVDSKGERYDEIGFSTLAASQFPSLDFNRNSMKKAASYDCRVYTGFNEEIRAQKNAVPLQECQATCDRWRSEVNAKNLPKQVRCTWGPIVIQRYEEGQCEVKRFSTTNDLKDVVYDDLNRGECNARCDSFSSWILRRCRWSPNESLTGSWQILREGRN